MFFHDFFTSNGIFSGCIWMSGNESKKSLIFGESGLDLTVYTGFGAENLVCLAIASRKQLLL